MENNDAADLSPIGIDEEIVLIDQPTINVPIARHTSNLSKCTEFIEPNSALLLDTITGSN